MVLCYRRTMAFPDLRILRAELAPVARAAGAKFTDALAWRLAGRAMTETRLGEAMRGLARAQNLSKRRLRVLGSSPPRFAACSGGPVPPLWGFKEAAAAA